MDRVIEGDQFDWHGCDAVQFNPLKLSGRATVGSSRMDADGVLLNYLSGMTAEEISLMFEVELEGVRGVLAFAQAKGLKEVA